MYFTTVCYVENTYLYMHRMYFQILYCSCSVPACYVLSNIDYFNIDVLFFNVNNESSHRHICLLCLMDRVLTNWQEVLYYDAIFASITNDASDELEGKETVAFLRRSQLPMEDIKAVGIVEIVLCRSIWLPFRVSRCKSTAMIFDIYYDWLH